MDELPSDAMRLLADAREAMGPSDADRQRVRRNLMMVTAAGAMSASVAHATGAATAKAGGALGLGLGGAGKLLIAAGLGVSVASAAYYGMQVRASHQTHETRGTRDTHTVSQLHTASSGSVMRAALPQAQQGLGAALPTPSPELQLTDQHERAPSEGSPATQRLGSTGDQQASAVLAQPAARRARAHGKRPAEHTARASAAGVTEAVGAPLATAIAQKEAASAAAADPVRASHVDEEVRLVRQAAAALREGHAQAAQALLREHAARFPGGMLSEEREGLAVLSSCALSEPGAAHSAAVFLGRSPRSPLVAHIRKACSDLP